MRNIYLVRHCETERCPGKRCIGITDIDLSENGVRQAHQLKEYFKDKQLSGIYCSGALRAVRTAEIISGGRIRVTKLAGLHEINMGDWDGMNFEDIKSRYPGEYERRGLDFAAFSPPRGESFSACQKRAAKALRYLLENTAGSIAVIAHAGFNRALICGLCNIDLQKLFAIPQPFGCVNILSVRNGTCRVRETGFLTDNE